MGYSSAGAAILNSEGFAGQLKAAGIIPERKIVGPDAFEIALIVNGNKLITKIEPRTTLAEVLRNHLDFTGTKIGCDRGACGACTVIMNGKTVASCMTLAIDAVGFEIETIEGLSSDVENLHPIQESFVEHDALQCGFCTPGMIISSKHLLDHNSNPDLNDIKKAVSGNLCRCGTYPKVFEAVKSAAKKSK
jgi:carbon-monoxide dehydrogenase small subunit/xanthine dehydrogenase YagT iron-sulfur-binding subunit